MSKLLIDDYPIQVLPKLAKEIGLNEAIFLQQLHYWLNSKSAKKINDRKWIYNTYDDWNKQFPFWSVMTVRRTVSSLIKRKLLVTGNFNKAGFDKTVWYSIDYEELDSVNRRCVQNEQTSCSNRTDGAVQNEHTNTIDYSETSTETNNNNMSKLKESNLDRLKSDFELIWSEYPKSRRKDKQKCFIRYKNALKDGDNHEDILAGLMRYKKEIAHKQTANEFIRLSSTWFNNKNWNDDYDVGQQENYSNFDNIDSKWVRQ